MIGPGELERGADVNLTVDAGDEVRDIKCCAVEGRRS